MLQLQIGFPTGRYCAACMHHAQPEWPPHPSRVYSALVAAAYAGGRQLLDEERKVLETLEQAGPPMLAFPEADTTAGATHYVPVNDDHSRFGKKSHGPLLPMRQPRNFPVAYLLGEPEVILTWPLDLDTDELELLDQLAARMTHLGTSHSLVTAHFTCCEVSTRGAYAPNPKGKLSLRVPLPGRLQELDELHEHRDGTVRRPQPLYEDVVTYAQVTTKPQAHASAYEWLAFRFKGATWGADIANILGKSVRKAIMSRLDAQAPAAVHGHDEEQLHVAWLPLPFVGHPHSDGRILGIGIALPISLTGQERNHTLIALKELLPCLKLPDGQVAELEPIIEGADTILTLRNQTWVGISTCWSTVTPVILDRPPKRFESSRVAQALVESLVNAGFPRPISVMLSQTSDFKGGPAVREIPTKLPRTHARVVFAEPLQGPIFAGRWKYFGIGLFRPTPSEYQP